MQQYYTVIHKRCDKHTYLASYSSVITLQSIVSKSFPTCIYSIVHATKLRKNWKLLKNGLPLYYRVHQFICSANTTLGNYALFSALFNFRAIIAYSSSLWRSHIDQVQKSYIPRLCILSSPHFPFYQWLNIILTHTQIISP